MILQNLTKAIRDQNWFAVGVEFLIVIAGVVIGFQIQGWNENRADRFEERSLLMRLHAEVVGLLEIQSEEYALNEPRAQSLAAVHPLLFDDIAPRELTAQECRQLGISNWLSAPTDELPVLEEIVSTGRFDLIADETVRTRLHRFALTRNRARRQYGEAVNELFRLAGRHPNAIWYLRIPSSSVPEHAMGRPEDWQLPRRAGAGYGWAYGCDLEAMRGSRAFLAEYVDNISRLNSYVERYEELIAVLSDLRAALDNELDLEGPQT
ncbi:hypothetical protein NHF45_10710 [Maricaulaceae bacterium NA33B04]|nr:hypothetical protein [Maricaulaceae bacterium NA33B04]